MQRSTIYIDPQTTPPSGENVQGAGQAGAAGKEAGMKSFGSEEEMGHVDPTVNTGYNLTCECGKTTVNSYKTQDTEGGKIRGVGLGVS